MTETTKDPLEQLREEFPAGTVGQLPKGGVMLDYVGHAAVTDRLLNVDPHWNWEPLSVDESGLPAYDAKGGLWIKLTVCGMTRLGYGDGPDPKQRIGDAIRNAAMRFGVALSLWTKDELESGHAESGASKATAPAAPRRAPSRQADAETGEIVLATQPQLAKIGVLFREMGWDGEDRRDDRHKYVEVSIGHSFESTKTLSKKEASAVIEQLLADKDAPAYSDDDPQREYE